MRLLMVESSSESQTHTRDNDPFKSVKLSSNLNF